MKRFSKINRGLIFTVAVALIAAIYIISLTSQVNAMKEESEQFMNEFFAADAAWKVIPEAYKEDYEGYIQEIGPEVRNYFADDGAYEFYIQTNIYEQYQRKDFYQTCGVFIQNVYYSGFDGGVLTMRFTIGINGKTDHIDREREPLRNTYNFSFKKVGGELKIYYTNYKIINSGETVEYTKPIYRYG